MSAIQQKYGRFSGFLLFSLAVTVMAWSLACPARASAAVLRACETFTTSVLPSVFAFSVAAKLCIRSGVLPRLPLGRFFRHLGLSVGGGVALTVGLLAGFPTGAAVLSELCSRGEISRIEAERLLPLCNNAGASFIVGTVGVSFFGAAETGVVLLLSQTASVLTALLLVGTYGADVPYTRRPTCSVIASLTSSVADGALAMPVICGYIAVFAVFGEMVAGVLPPSPLVRALTQGVLELSGGMAALSCLSLPRVYRLALGGAMLGFGGVCVFLQAAERATPQGLRCHFYFRTKLLQAALCALYAILFDRLGTLRYAYGAQIAVFVVIFTIASVKNKIFFKKSVEKRKGMLYNRNENPCP
ncbi:MAG: hypothetical protein IJV98_01940 [Clostridia bacterium]|nr:hypothetical protein [Clostridia bacterium]